MDFVYSAYHREISDDQLIFDVQRVREELKQRSISAEEYDAHGEYSSSTVSRRFGSWNKALEKAGIEARNVFHTKEELLANIEEVWIKKGEQPTRRDMDDKRLSSISSGAYLRMFRRWSDALQSFVAYVNAEHGIELREQSEGTMARSGESRDVNLRLRFLVMKRDNFKCCACGRSPATDPTVVLHIDHVIPWSRGGRTEMSNLQTLCEKCNLGKSNVM